jgi:hypothetical protein
MWVVGYSLSFSPLETTIILATKTFLSMKFAREKAFPDDVFLSKSHVVFWALSSVCGCLENR